MNNSNYTVIHSKDPWLLARLSTDLMMEGIGRTDFQIELIERSPFDENESFKWLCLYRNNKFGFYNHDCGASKFRKRSRHDKIITITASNYLQVLTTIIERHGK